MIRQWLVVISCTQDESNRYSSGGDQALFLRLFGLDERIRSGWLFVLLFEYTTLSNVLQIHSVMNWRPNKQWQRLYDMLIIAGIWKTNMADMICKSTFSTRCLNWLCRQSKLSGSQAFIPEYALFCHVDDNHVICDCCRGTFTWSTHCHFLSFHHKSHAIHLRVIRLLLRDRYDYRQD